MANLKAFSIDIDNCAFFDLKVSLANALANGDIINFRIALDKGANPLVPDETTHMTTFEQALKTHGCAEFVEECLKRGCEPNHINQQLKKAAINFATDSRDPHILAALLRHRSAIQVDHKYEELTPLNSLAKAITKDNINEVMACIRLLLNYGASPNIPDQRQMTPILYVLKQRKIDEHKKRELIQMFLECHNVDLDSYRDGEARAILKGDYPEFQLATTTQEHDITFDMLLAYVRNENEEKFLQQYAVYNPTVSGEEKARNIVQKENLELLIEAIKQGMQKAIDIILQKDVNINETHKGNTAIEIAALWGNWRALQTLLDHEDLRLRKEDHLLIAVVKKIDQKPTRDFVDFNTCFYTLLNSDKIDVNEIDKSHSTPLHYAVKYRNRKVIQELLKRGAYIGTKSGFGDLPIDDMHSEILEEHFNDCISSNGLKAGDIDFQIHMDFMNLIPPQPNSMKKVQLHSDKPSKDLSYKVHDEMAPIAFIADSKELRHLLQHPLITSFLFLKWHRLSVVFYVNFLLYTLFAVSIITHTVLKFRESEHEAVIILFGILSWIGIIYLVFREILQFIMSPISYFCSGTNYLEILLIILSVLTCVEATYDVETHRVIAVFTILLVALELCLLVGSLPVPSISTHMLMLRTVLTSFLKSFTLYSIFVITFSLCFYILFGKEKAIENGAAVGGDPSAMGSGEEGDFNKFQNPFTAVIKTIVMLTGEFDAGDLGMDSFSSYLLFLLFVVFMSIVLFNLLNGLAVSDTQIIKAQAELNGSIVRTNLLTRYEKELTGRTGRVSFIVNHEPFKTICSRLMNLYPNYIAGRKIAILPNDSNKILIPNIKSYEVKEEEMLMHGSNGKQFSTPKFLPLNSEMDSDAPKNLIPLDAPVDFLPCCCSCMTGKCAVMDNRTVKLAMAVIDQKTNVLLERKRSQDTERRLQNIEKKLEKVFEIVLALKNQ